MTWVWMWLLCWPPSSNATRERNPPISLGWERCGKGLKIVSSPVTSCLLKVEATYFISPPPYLQSKITECNAFSLFPFLLIFLTVELEAVFFVWGFPFIWDGPGLPVGCAYQDHLVTDFVPPAQPSPSLKARHWGRAASGGTALCCPRADPSSKGH